MDAAAAAALETDKVIDITTTGRKSGEVRRIEIWFHHLDGRYFITGRPGRRSWYANLVAHPEFTFHLKEGAQADLPASARAITKDDERREVLTNLVANIGGDQSLGEWLSGAPLIEVTFKD
jgi:deazaflavin-dependent oxidoreductase (nitroreductase family)